MRFGLLLLFVVLLPGATAFAQAPDLAFKADGEGLFVFDTGVLRGRLKLDGDYQGLYPLIDVKTGTELVHPPGVFSFYRILTAKGRYGKAARDWPTEASLLPSGAVQVRWPAAKEHPLEMTAIYRWSAPDTLDLEIAVTPQVDMPGFELFMSSYFSKGFRASVFLKNDDESRPRFYPVDRTPDSRGAYVMFPKDERSQAAIYDGRWAIPPNAVNWETHGRLAEPLALRRDLALGLTAAMMSPANDCFAVSCPWNPRTPEAGGYRSLYQSLFGQDLKAGETAEARCRLIIGRNLSDDDVLDRYKQYSGATSR